MNLLNLLHKQRIYVICVFLTITMLSWVTYAQITILPPNLSFTQACASPGFNTYNFSFSFYPAHNLGTENEFIIELSDGNGDFSNPTPVATLTNNTSPVLGSFELPTDTAGENYQVRVRSTYPEQTSLPSSAFSAYYAIHNQPYSINNYNSTINLCEGDSFLLEVDNPGNASSPAYYPNLQYIWYKNYIEIPGETEASILITEPGAYYSIVDYGSCVMNSYSNIVTVQVAPNISPTIETSDGLHSICPSESKTLISTLQDPNYTYTWFKNNNPIPSSNMPTYDAVSEGSYHLEIDNGGCIFSSNSIFLEVTDIDAYLDIVSNVMLVPGESLTVTATTTANSPTIQWFKNNVAIPGATYLSYTVTQPGDYSIVISQTTPCVIDTVLNLLVIYPESINLAINPDASYIACNSLSTSLSANVFEAVSPLETLNILNNTLGYIYQWYYYGVPIYGANTLNYTVPNSEANGPYFLEVTIPDYGVVYSNNINVNLGIGSILISNDQELCSNQTVTFTSSVTTTAHSYQWFKDGIVINGATSPTYATTEAGTYNLSVTNGTCQNNSNSITINSSSISVTPTAALTDIIIPGQTKTLSVSTSATNPTYSWFRNNVSIPGAVSSSYDASLDGSYKVVVNQSDSCNLEEDITFTLEYPNSFNVELSPETNYTACSSTSTTLRIDQFSAETDSGAINILNNSFNYTYQWFKNNIAIPGASNTELNISSAADNGDYHLEITIPDFGIQTTNILTINLATEALIIENTGALCPGEFTTLSANISDTNYTYQWLHDGVVIPGATAETYTTNLEGNYQLEIDNGTCSSSSNSLSLAFGQLNIYSTNLDNDVILPGENKVITVTTDASQPSFAWYHNNVLLANETSATFTATQSGTYKVIASVTEACTLYAEKTFILDNPLDYNIEIAIDPTYDSCTSNSMPINLITFEAITTNGNLDILNNTQITYTAQWFKNNSLATGETDTSIDLVDISDNGDYKLQLSIDAFGTVTSNTISANLDTNQPLIITSSGLFCSGNPQLDINSNISNTNYVYTWYHNGNLLATNNNATLTITEIGNYQLFINTGSCTKESNILAIEESFITLTPTTELNSVLIPGNTVELSVSSDALQPNYHWSFNGTLIPGANTNSYNTDASGEYEVVVTQTIGCIMEDSLTFIVSNPTNFQAVIAADTNYTPCVSLETSLSLTSFTAEALSNTINLIDNPYNYNLQWYKDGDAILDENDSSITISNYESNGNYQLEINIPNMGTLMSNTLNITLGFISEVEIYTNDILCETNTTVTLYSDITNPAYSYQWYQEETGNPLGNATEQEVTESGNYYLEISYGDCNISSNSVTVNSLNADAITLNYPDAIDLIENTTITIIAEGGDSYEWYFNNASVSVTNALEISEAGTYTLIALIGNCSVTKTLIVTEIENKTVAIPNVVTLNNDGINDTWGLPAKYVAKDNVDIVIYDSSGKIVLKQHNYMNNWPATDFEFSQKQPVYYYTISEDNIITEKGTITLIK
ncbi:T9SS type B sorting domain-containing protein [Bizionia sp. KMM 8389]